MQQKLCLWLFVAVLLGALCTGNPFLRPGDAGRSAAPSPAPSAPGHSELAIRTSSPAPGGRREALPAVVRDAERQPAAASAFALRAVAPPRGAEPECPDPDLRLRVLGVEFVGDEPVWVLDDGRRVMRNRRPGPGAPLVVDWAPGDEKQ